MEPTTKYDWTVLEARIDWVTATAQHGEGANELLDAGLRIMQEVNIGGTRGRQSYFEGYAGTAGNGVFAGWRADGACVRLSGGSARDRALSLIASQCKVTRIDLAVTARTSDGTNHVGQEAYRLGCNHRPRVGKPNECTLIVSRSGGETVYFGMRSSERFGRIYNKTVESKGEYPEHSWRWELEYKGEAAVGLAAWLQGHQNLESSILSSVRQRFADWGVSVPITIPHIAWRDKSIYGRTDNETRMRWLAKSVAPSIERLATEYDRETLLKQLGLWYTGADGQAGNMQPPSQE